MKYNTVADFRDQTARAGELAKSSARAYAKAVEYLLKDQHIMNCKDMNVASVIDKLKGMEYKGQYSLYKNAFLKFCDYIECKLSDEEKKQILEMRNSKKKKNRKLRPQKLDNIKEQINSIKDKKLKLSFETMLCSGLRVSEISQIEKEDCVIRKNEIELQFIGKGQNKEKVIIDKEDDEKLFNRISSLIKETKSNKRVFYSKGYLQEKAKDKDFVCHDLRRAFAKTKYKEFHNIKTVQKYMRHKKKENTELYLKSKVDI